MAKLTATPRAPDGVEAGPDDLLPVDEARRQILPRLTPLPVQTATIKNDHLEYAITWFSLAFVWAMMTMFLIFRTTRQKDA